MEVSNRNGKVVARKFASGFHGIHVSKPTQTDDASPAYLSVDEQEQVLRFHCHQIQALVGPTAIRSELRTSALVLSTAITLLRRFYLSNSVVDIHPRSIAVACAFLAAKLEEEKIEVSTPKHIATMSLGRLVDQILQSII